MGHFVSNQIFEVKELSTEADTEWNIPENASRVTGMVAVRAMDSHVVVAILTTEQFSQQYTEIPEEG